MTDWIIGSVIGVCALFLLSLVAVLLLGSRQGGLHRGKKLF